MVEEAPYWLLVRELGHSEADRLLGEDPGAGALVATAERPSTDALAAELWIDPGTGPALEGVVAFAPTAQLSADLPDDPEARVIPVSGWQDIGEVDIGTLASIDGELVRIDGITPTAITVGRGCLDTVPRAHAAGTPVVFFDEGARITETAWAAGETLAARLLPETGRGTLAFALAPEDRVTLDRRAIRPLPPGRVQANGSYTPDVDALISAELVLTWSHRDRLTQTSPVIVDHTGPSIGPEPGVGYGIEVRWIDPDTDVAVLPAAAVIDAGDAITRTRVTGRHPRGRRPGPHGRDRDRRPGTAPRGGHLAHRPGGALVSSDRTLCRRMGSRLGLSLGQLSPPITPLTKTTTNEDTHAGTDHAGAGAARLL